MSLIPGRPDAMLRMLIRVQAGEGLSQRALARELGLALGYVNRLLNRAIKRRWVRVRSGADVRYVLTEAGARALRGRWRGGIENMLGTYAELRLHVQHRIREISDSIPTTTDAGAEADGGQGAVIFYGVNDLAELAYVSLPDAGLKLVGVVDDARSGSFMGMPIRATDSLAATELDGSAFDRVIVVKGESGEAERKLAAAGVHPQRVCWL